MVGVGDQTADERSDADPEIHHHALHRERRVPPVGRRQPGEQRRLRGPEEAVADPGHGGGEKALPRRVHEREGAVADGEDDE